MNSSGSQRVAVSALLNGTILSRKTKRKKGRELEGAQDYRTYYLSLDHRDIESLGLRERDRLTIGIVRIQKQTA